MDKCFINRGVNTGIQKSAWIIIIACCCGYLLLSFVYFDATIDDAYIVYRYASNFSQGHGLTFNKGQKPVEGYSDFLFVVILAGLHKMGADIPVTSKVLGILSGLAILIILPFFMRRIWQEEETKPSGSWLATFLLCPMTPFILWSIAGLETLFYTFLITLAAYYKIAELSEDKKFPWSGLVFAAVALTRPEGAMFFFITALFVIALWKFKGRKPTRNDILWATMFLFPFLLHLLWRYSYYGYWLPNTYYVKASGASLTATASITSPVRYGLRYLGKFIFDYGLLMLFAAILFSLYRLRQFRTQRLLLTLFVIMQILFILQVGGDWMSSFRFVVPVIPLLCLMSAIAIIKVGSKITVTWELPKWIIPCVFIFFLVSSRAWGLYAHFESHWRPWARGLYQGHGKIANWLKENASPEQTAAVHDMGLISYVSDLHIIDLVGLANEYFAHLPGVWYKDKYDVNWVLNKKPDFIILNSKTSLEKSGFDGVMPIDKDLAGHPRFSANYVFLLEGEFSKGHWVVMWQRKKP